MLLEILRELIVVVAAAGVAAAAWIWVLGRAGREQALLAAQSRSEAQGRELKAAIAGLDARLESVGGSVAKLTERRQDEEQRWTTRIAIHALLHATRDPFLSFEEIENALSSSKRPDGERQAAAGSLRRVLMEMVADGVIAQLDRDRYFIASDFEAGDGSDDADS